MMNKWTYYKLLGDKHKDVIIRANGPRQERYYPDKGQWVRSGIMLEYFCDESSTYDMYEEISETQASGIVGSDLNAG